MPPDPFGKNQLFCEEGAAGHQFFFTTGRKSASRKKINVIEIPYSRRGYQIAVQWKSLTRYTVRGRGAKHFFPSGSGLEPTFYLIRSRTSLPELPDFRQYPGMKSRQIMDFIFQKVLKKSHIWWSKKGPWTGISQSLTSLTAIHFLDRSKSKAQTTGRQQPWNTLHIPFVKTNYVCEEEEEAGHPFFFTTGRKKCFAQ